MLRELKIFTKMYRFRKFLESCVLKYNDIYTLHIHIYISLQEVSLTKDRYNKEKYSVNCNYLRFEKKIATLL